MPSKTVHNLVASLLLLFSVSGFAFDPGTTFKDLDGNETKLSKHVGQGQWTLLMVWASDCTICAMEAPDISAFHDTNDSNVSVIGVALDGYANKRDVQGFIDQYGMTFPQLIGDLAVVALNYEAATGESLRGTPTFLLYQPDGTLVANNPGPLRTEAVESYIAGKSQ